MQQSPQESEIEKSNIPEFFFNKKENMVLSLNKKEEDALTDNTNISDEFDVVSFSGRVHSKIKADGIITEDFTLALFPDKEKEYVAEQISDAYTVKALISRLSPSVAQRIFQQMTLRTQIIAIVNRNVKNNHLLTHYFTKLKNDEADALTLGQIENKKQQPQKGETDEA